MDVEMIYLVCYIKSIIMTELVDTYISALSEPWHKGQTKSYSPVPLFICCW